VAALTAAEGAAVAKPADPTRSGYTFTGWYSAETGGTAYSWPHTLSADVTMHAQWLAEGETPPTQYTLTFDSHGGSAVAALTAAEGAAVAKPADPTRSGYTFTGWYSAASGGTAYSWPHALSASLTMHAQWQVLAYTITYNLNGGTNNAANPAAYTIESAAITLAAPARNGYTFGGWYGYEDLTGTAVTAIPAGSTGNKTFWAKWTLSTTAQGITLTIDDFIDPAGGAVPDTVITLRKSGAPETKTLHISGSDDDTQAAWYVGIVQIHTGSSVTLNAASLSLGTHTLRVSVEYGGVRHSKEITLRVED
jgi:uncharacterized repeat protein (TIGR02543 family)